MTQSRRATVFRAGLKRTLSQGARRPLHEPRGLRLRVGNSQQRHNPANKAPPPPGFVPLRMRCSLLGVRPSHLIFPFCAFRVLCGHNSGRWTTECTEHTECRRTRGVKPQIAQMNTGLNTPNLSFRGLLSGSYLCHLRLNRFGRVGPRSAQTAQSESQIRTLIA